MPPRYMTPDPNEPHGQQAAYPTYDAGDAVHAEQAPPGALPTQPLHQQAPTVLSAANPNPYDAPTQPTIVPVAQPPISEGGEYLDDHRRDSDPFHNSNVATQGTTYPPPSSELEAERIAQLQQQQPLAMAYHQVNDPYLHHPQDGVYHEHHDHDRPLLPPGHAPYGYAPASAFDHDGHLRAGVGGVSDWGDGQNVIEDADIDGMARGRKMEAGYSGDDDYFPGGWANGDADLEEAVPTGIRYGRIPQRVPRRYKTLKRVELYHGNLVLDCPVPSRLLERLNDRESREFTHMRYTAATCDPDNFKDERYTLRQVLFDPPRKTELFIVLTMYNEDEQLFCRTLHGVMTNIAHLCTRERSKTWGKDGWKKVVVAIVSDGRLKINARVLAVLAAMGVYQEGVGKNMVNGKPVTAHIYEYTTQLSIDPDLKFRGREKGIMPVQILFCLKERNQKKINSHRWFFNAFGSILQPNVCVLLDVGTMPRSKSIYHLWKSFDINSNVAGACGEIVALKGKMWTGLLNPLVAAQNFEYKMSNILDKPLESVFGYITVLPGAFSAYRYFALQNDALQQGPLASYFKGETLHGGSTNSDIFTSNMYLAEDRILCWELTSKRDSHWILHYVKSAQAETDVPDTVPELITQRRRWLNGSFFAGIHSIVKFGYIYRSSHSIGRKLALHVELLYQTVTLIFSWFGMANYFIAFSILSTSLADEVKALRIPGIVLSYLYVALIIFNFLLAMGNRPAGSKWAYSVSMVAFALLTIYMTAAAVYLAVTAIIDAENTSDSADALVSNGTFVNIVISLAATYGVWLISSILFFEPWHMFTSLIQYILMAPSFVNVINIYAFCNVHDVSWGTKGSDQVQTDLGVVAGSTEDKNQVDVAIPTDTTDINEHYIDACHMLTTRAVQEEKKVDLDQKQKDYYATVRTNVVTVWAVSNAALAVAIVNIGSSSVKSTYMGFLLYSVAGLAAFRMIGSMVYLVKRLFSGE